MKCITVKFCTDTKISKTQSLLIQNKDESWSVLMRFKKGKLAKQEDYDKIMLHFKDSFRGDC